MRRTNKSYEAELAFELAEEPQLESLAQYAVDGWVSLSFQCEVSPYDPGRLSGPWEDCYPPEGGELERVSGAYVVDANRAPHQIDAKLAAVLADHFSDRIVAELESLVEDDCGGSDPDDY